MNRNICINNDIMGDELILKVERIKEKSRKEKKRSIDHSGQIKSK